MGDDFGNAWLHLPGEVSCLERIKIGAVAPVHRLNGTGSGALDDTLLIYAPVPLYRDAAGELHIEAQAVNGLRLWAANFSEVIVMMPMESAAPPAGWVPVSETGSSLDRVRLEVLPLAYRPDRFFRALPATRRRIEELIGRARYLSFAIGGLFGDWGAVAAFAAHRMGRPFAVWTDRVESEVVRRGASSGHWRARLRARLTHRPMAALERAVIRRAALGLFHGKETYDTYAPHCRGPAEVVHDIHLSRKDHISPEALDAKIAGAAEGPLRIFYAGRAEPMKGPLDWVEVLERLAALGVDFRARWLGDGSEREAMVERIEAAGLGARVEMPGFVSGRDTVIAELQASHVFLFCHLTPESPRCLIEALASGCPIVGYESPYPSDLIAEHGGGLLVPARDTAALAQQLAALSADRRRLGSLMQAAAADGAPFVDEAVFRHRSEVIRRHLGGREQEQGGEAADSET
jgi:glycosyltransferase involved in cell wall biosynthesis